MKKLLVVSVIAFTMVFSVLYACEMEISPEKITVEKDKVFEIEVIIEHEHRRCELTNEDTQYETEGVEIVARGEWQQLARGKFAQKLKIKLVMDRGRLRAFRECSRKGISEAFLDIKAK